MGLFDVFKKKPAISFAEIDSIDKAKAEYRKGNLEQIYIVSPVFGGAEDDSNILYVPVGTGKFKERFDNMLVDLVKQGKAKSFNCKPEYKEKSVVPSRITIVAGKDGVDVLKETIDVW